MTDEVKLPQTRAERRLADSIARRKVTPHRNISGCYKQLSSLKKQSTDSD